MITILAAIDRRWGICKNGGIPWDLPEDRISFANLTRGSTVVMGRKTFESLPKPLKDREVVVLTSKDASYGRDKGAIAASSVSEVLARWGGARLYVAGGAPVYSAFLRYADQAVITTVDGDYDCDVSSFPVWDDVRTNKIVHGKPQVSRTGLHYMDSIYFLAPNRGDAYYRHKDSFVGFNL